MAIVEWKVEDGVGIITMNNGENRHNPLFAKGMLDAFGELEKDKAVSSVVITSSDQKNWSQGIDLDWMTGRMGEKDFQSVKDFIYVMNEVFKRALLFPTPLICAINGHAVANGAIFSCACDFRFMRSDKGFFFFPEVDIGIPFLPGMIAFVKKSIPFYKFEEMLYSGKRYTALELERHHVIVKACENEEALMSEAFGLAKTYRKKRGIFGEMKKRMHKEMIEVLDKEDPPFVEAMQLFVGD